MKRLKIVNMNYTWLFVKKWIWYSYFSCHWKHFFFYFSCHFSSQFCDRVLKFSYYTFRYNYYDAYVNLFIKSYPCCNVLQIETNKSRDLSLTVCFDHTCAKDWCSHVAPCCTSLSESSSLGIFLTDLTYPF